MRALYDHCRALVARVDGLVLADWPPSGENGGFLTIEADMADGDDEYVFDEATGEWRPAGDVAATAVAERGVVRDSAGTVLADGDSVALIKDLKVKGANQTLKQGTIIKSIRLTDNDEEIDCRYDAIKGLVLRTEFVRKR